MRRYVLTACLLAVASPALAQTKATDTALIVANGLDLASTAYALHKGGTEANPLMGSGLVSIVPIKIGGTVVNVWINHLLARNHPKLAKVTAWTISGLLTSVAAHNLTVHGPQQP